MSDQLWIAVRKVDNPCIPVFLLSDGKKMSRWIEKDLKPTGVKILFTNGCFDLYHLGHAESLCRMKYAYPYSFIVVGLNSDESVRRLKGPTRPIYKQDHRMAMLMTQIFVGCVIVFEEDTPENLIKIVRPDVLFKGGDYAEKDIAGADFVRSYGGDVHTVPMLESYSSTGELERIGELFMKERFGKDCLVVKAG